jgi:hypothetical protein
MADYTVPFAPSGYQRPERYTNPYVGSLLELMQGQARAQAAADERRMALAGQLWQNIAQTGAGVAQAIAEAPERKRQQELQRVQYDQAMRQRDIQTAVDNMPLTVDPVARQKYLTPLTSPQRRQVEELYRAEDIAAQERQDAVLNRRGEEALAAVGTPGAFSSLLTEKLKRGEMSPQQYGQTLAAAGDSGDPAQYEADALTSVYLSSPAGRKAVADAQASDIVKRMAAAPDARKTALVQQMLQPGMTATDQLRVFRTVWGPQGDAKFKEYADALKAAAPTLTTFSENQGVMEADPLTGQPTTVREPSPDANATFQDVDAKVTTPDGKTYVGKVGFNPRTNSYAPIGSREPFPPGTRVERAPTPMDPTLAAIRDAQLALLRGRAGGPGELSQAQFAHAMQLTNSLKAHPAYADMSDIATGWQGVQAGLSQNNGFGDIVAINAIQRMVDPGATVREGDVALLQSASALLDKVVSDYPLAKLRTGDKLPQAVRNRLRAVAEQLYAARSKNYNDTIGSQYRALAAAAGIPFELIGADFAAPSAAPTEGTEGMVNGVPAIWKTVNGKAGWYAR